MNKQFILANIDEAVRLVTEHPESQLNLDAYEQKVECGTLYCTAGLLTTSEHFRALGWSLHRRVDKGYAWVHVNGQEITNDRTEPHFGPDANRNLFSSAGGGDFDWKSCLVFDVEDGTGEGHKELALYRLARQRAIVEAM